MTSDEVLVSLRKIIRALNLESKRIQKEFGVSIPQMLCLNFLNQAPDFQANTKQLSEGLTLNPSTISGIVSRLAQKGYVSRLPKSGDKRVSTIILTASGARLLKNTPKLFHEKLDERLSKLSEEQLFKIKDGLNLLISLLEVDKIDASPMLTTEFSPKIDEGTSGQ